MDNSTIWRWILIGVLVLVAIQVLKFVLGFLATVVHIGLTIAVIVGIIWLLTQVFAKRNSY